MSEEPIEDDAYVKVEQLEDVDFEKEKEEKNKNKKFKNILILIIGIAVLFIVGICAYFAMGSGNPRIVIEEFLSNVNSSNFDEALDNIDLKGMYALITTYEGEQVDENTNYEKYYTKFDTRFENIEKEEGYKEFIELNSIINSNVKQHFEGVEFKVTAIEDPILIQGTKGLYKIKTNIDMAAQEQTQSIQIDFYLNRTLFSYKIVGGYIPELLISLNEYYNELEKYQIKIDTDFVNELETANETLAEYIEAFNSQDYTTLFNLTDLVGFYTLNTITTDENVEDYEPYYTQYDQRYEVAKNETGCEDLIYLYSMISEKTISTLFNNANVNISNVQEPVLVQDTRGLYSIEADVVVHVEGVEDYSEHVKFYINKTDNGYKIVGGDVPSLILYLMYAYSSM